MDGIVGEVPFRGRGWGGGSLVDGGDVNLEEMGGRSMYICMVSLPCISLPIWSTPCL